MKITVSFANPFLATIYTVAMLMTGWAIGAQWGYTLTSGWMLFFATVFFVLHDAVIAILLAIAAAKVASAGRRNS